ncbi:MAG TPA: hypothetical protein PKA95_09600, partial [Thermomicrobiales bacterium]|nr:hypothetical protein [Thermomicrobiales bacterium]
MTDLALQTWAEQNQRYLSVALAAVRQRLEPGGSDATTADDLRVLAGEMPAPPAIEALAQGFDLSSFERDLLLLCAGVELDAGIAAAVARGGGPLPTFGLALATLDAPHWSALSPARPLRRWRLVDLLDSRTLTGSPLRIDERVLHYLTGGQYLDERLAGVVEVDDGSRSLAPSHEQVADAIVAAWAAGADMSALIQLVGAEPGTARTIAAGAAERLGASLAVLSVADIPAAAREREELMRLWEREAVLGSSVLLVDCLDLDGGPAEERAALALPGNIASPVIAAIRR